MRKPNRAQFKDKSPSKRTDRKLIPWCKMLAGLGVTKFMVSYAGSGDEGEVADIAWEPQEIQIFQMALDQIKKLCAAYCPSGYESGAGGHGYIEVWPAQQLATLCHINVVEGSESMDIGDTELPTDLHNELVRLHVAKVEMGFDGCGDSGDTEWKSIELTDGTSRTRLPGQILKQLGAFLEDLLPGGWEVNEGGWGTITVDVATADVVVDGYANIEEEEEAVLTRWKLEEA